MKKRHLIGILAVLTAVSTACKDDSETDLITGSSDIKGLYINEVCTSGTDWIELYNGSDSEISLGGFLLQDSKGADEEYTFPSGAKIGSKSYLVLYKESDFSFGLSGSGDAVTLIDNQGHIIDNILVPALDDGQTYARESDGSSTWVVLSSGTPGRDNTSEGDDNTPETSSLKLYINEVLSSPAGDDTDFIEIYNGEEQAVNIGGFILQDDKKEAEEFIIPEGTVIAAKGFVVYSQVSPGEGDSFTFGLSSGGDKVIFLDKERKLIDEVETPDFKSAGQEGFSYGRTTDGGNQWSVIESPTKGTSNGASTGNGLAGQLLINEVYTFSDQSSIDDLDFIELYNAGSNTIDLSGLKMWESGGQEEAWTFPEGKKIAAGERLVIECDKEGYYNDPTNYPAWGLSKGPDEYIVLADANLNIIDEVHCPSLKQYESYGRLSDGSDQWVIFAQYSQGTANGGEQRQPVTNTLGLCINEVFTNNQDVQTQPWDDTKDFIELYNSSDNAIDLSGFSLMDDALDPEKQYFFPDGTVIAAKSFLTLDVDKKNTNGPVFGLGKGGDWVFLYDASGRLIAEIEAPAFEDSEVYSVGRRTDGGDEIVVFTEVSKNNSNNGKAIK